MIRNVDYSKRVTVPIRDVDHPAAPIVFLVDIYGVEAKDLAVVPGGGAPMYKAVTRMGLDPVRFQALLWDLPI
jgi:hypothetical protein